MITKHSPNCQTCKGLVPDGVNERVQLAASTSDLATSADRDCTTCSILVEAIRWYLSEHQEHEFVWSEMDAFTVTGHASKGSELRLSFYTDVHVEIELFTIKGSTLRLFPFFSFHDYASLRTV